MKRAALKEFHELPLNKRWPGKFAVRLRVYTPKGNMLEFETNLPDDYAGELLREFARALNGDHPRPALAKPPAGDAP